MTNVMINVKQTATQTGGSARFTNVCM